LPGGARKKQVRGEGFVHFTVACWMLQQAERSILCLTDAPVKAVSIRHRADHQAALIARPHVLEMCLLGRDCPNYQPGPPPL
jgi:hypothetical protein